MTRCATSLVTPAKDSLWKADPVGGTQFRDPNDPEQMLLEFTPDPGLAPLRRILREHIKHQSGQTATVKQLREYTLEHTVYKKVHTALALEELRSRQEITTIPHQKRITAHLRDAVHVTAAAIGPGELFAM